MSHRLVLRRLMIAMNFHNHHRGMAKGPQWPPAPWPAMPDIKLYEHLSNKERKDHGFPCLFDEPALVEDAYKAKRLIRQFNTAEVDDDALRMEILKKLFNKKSGTQIYVEPPLLVDYGYNITVGDGFFANFDCCFLDTAPITIGKNVMIAPKVNLFTASHPLHPVERMEYQLAKPITIGNDCWLGGGVTVYPGVTIGDGVVIAGASAVTKNVPSFCVVGGNPARIIKYLPGAEDPRGGPIGGSSTSSRPPPPPPPQAALSCSSGRANTSDSGPSSRAPEPPAPPKKRGKLPPHLM